MAVICSPWSWGIWIYTHIYIYIYVCMYDYIMNGCESTKRLRLRLRWISMVAECDWFGPPELCRSDLPPPWRDARDFRFKEIEASRFWGNYCNYSFGKDTKNNGKFTMLLLGKSTINGPFSIAKCKRLPSGERTNILPWKDPPMFYMGK